MTISAQPTTKKILRLGPAATRAVVPPAQIENELDLEHIAEEIEDLGRSDLRARGPVPSAPLSSGLSGRSPARVDSGAFIELLLSRTFAQQHGGRSLDILLKLRHQPFARPTGRYRLEKFERDPATTLEKAPSPPEKPGIERRRNNW